MKLALPKSVLPGASSERADLPIIGMTCASCANTVEKALGKAAGVTKASVNFATKIATVMYNPASTDPTKLAAAVHATGYEATVPEAAVSRSGEKMSAMPGMTAGEHAHMHEGAGAQAVLVRKLIVGAVLSLPVLIIAMSHGKVAAFNHPWINWLQLVLSTPVVFWCGSQFFRMGWMSSTFLNLPDSCTT